ncbi:unnamed protein product [Gordionus sp. m RMFG-2023]
MKHAGQRLKYQITTLLGIIPILILLCIDRVKGQGYEPRSGLHTIQSSEYGPSEDYGNEYYPPNWAQSSSGDWSSSGTSSKKKPIIQQVQSSKKSSARRCVSCQDDEALSTTFCTSPTFRGSMKSGSILPRMCPTNTFCDARLLVDNFGCCCPLPAMLTTTTQVSTTAVSLPTLTVFTFPYGPCVGGEVKVPNCNPCSGLTSCTPSAQIVFCFVRDCGTCTRLTFRFPDVVTLVCT